MVAIEMIIIEMAKTSHIVAVLVWMILYFKKKEKDNGIIVKDKDEHIQELNEAWRKSNEDSMKIISRLSSSIDKFSFISTKNKEEVMNELDHLKEILGKKNNY